MVPNLVDSDPSKSAINGVDELESIERFRDETLPTEGVDGPSIGGDRRDGDRRSDINIPPTERDFLWCTSTGELNVLEIDADAARICRCG